MIRFTSRLPTTIPLGLCLSIFRSSNRSIKAHLAVAANSRLLQFDAHMALRLLVPHHRAGIQKIARRFVRVRGVGILQRVAGPMCGQRFWSIHDVKPGAETAPDRSSLTIAPGAGLFLLIGQHTRIPTQCVTFTDGRGVAHLLYGFDKRILNIVSPHRGNQR